MAVAEYIIDVAQFEIDHILEDWAWGVPSDSHIIALSKFGDLFLSSEGRIFFLDTLDASLVDLKLSSEGFALDETFVQKHANLLSLDWVEICATRGLSLMAGECYGWKLHPLLGGAFAFENIGVFSVRVYPSLCGQLIRQLQRR